MKFDITGRHIEVTEAIKSHVDGQLAKLDKVFDGKPAQAHVIIEVERGRHHSEVVVNWRSEVLTAATSDSDMYNSISMTVDKIEKQARKMTSKVIDKSHKAVKVSTLPHNDEMAD